MSTGFTDRFKGAIQGSWRSLVQFGKSSAAMTLSGNMNVQGSSAGVGNGADTTEDTLYTYSLPANALDKAGRSVNILAYGTLANNAHTKTVYLSWGTSVKLQLSCGTVANQAWVMMLEIVKDAASSSQMVNGQSALGSTHNGNQYFHGVELETAAIVCKVTGQTANAVANDVVANSFQVAGQN